MENNRSSLIIRIREIIIVDTVSLVVFIFSPPRKVELVVNHISFCKTLSRGQISRLRTPRTIINSNDIADLDKIGESI